MAELAPAGTADSANVVGGVRGKFVMEEEVFFFDSAAKKYTLRISHGAIL